jgi:hypothetical protein
MDAVTHRVVIAAAVLGIMACGDKEEDSAVEAEECVESFLCEEWLEVYTACGDEYGLGTDNADCDPEWRFQPSLVPYFECMIEAYEDSCATDLPSGTAICGDVLVEVPEAEWRRSQECTCVHGYGIYDSCDEG